MIQIKIYDISFIFCKIKLRIPLKNNTVTFKRVQVQPRAPYNRKTHKQRHIEFPFGKYVRNKNAKHVKKISWTLKGQGFALRPFVRCTTKCTNIRVQVGPTKRRAVVLELLLLLQLQIGVSPKENLWDISWRPRPGARAHSKGHIMAFPVSNVPDKNSTAP